jgi:hypothetical protein
MKTKSLSPVIELISDENPSVDPEVAKQVGQEILENRLDPGTWAQALSSSGGERQEALAAYARIRIQQVTTRRRLRLSKVKSFEFRRVTKCFGVKTVHDLLQRSNPGKQVNFLRPRLSVFSLLTLGIGAAGCVAAAGRLMESTLPERLSAYLPVVAVVCGLAAVTATISLRYVLPKRWIMLGWNSGMQLACMAACFASLMFGVKLIAHAPPLETTHVSKAKPLVVASPKPVLIKGKLKRESLTAQNNASR